MLDQILEGFRKASESSLQLQQELWKSWGQQWLSGTMGANPAAEWARIFQKRWLHLTLDVLEKQRQALDSSFKAGMQAIERALRASEAGGAEDYRRLAEELWHKLFQTVRSEYDNQFQDVKRWAETSFQLAQSQSQERRS